MAEYLITGGGAALDNALNKRNGFSYANGDTLWVGPGIYTPIFFAQYNQNIHVRSTDGRESTIIDGLGLSTCLRNNYSNTSYMFSFYGFTLRNGYLSSDLSSPTFNGASYSGAGTHGAVRMFDSNIYDCSAANYHSDPTGSSYRHIAAVWSGNGTGGAYNCEISGCVGLNAMLFNQGQCRACNIHHNVSTLPYKGDKSIAFQIGFYRCRIHHNTFAGIWHYGGTCQSLLLYENESSSGSNFLFERGRLKNCIVVNNKNFGTIENGWGSASKLENCVYAGNVPYGTNKHATIYSNSNNTAIFNCAFDKLSTQWANWSNFSTTYPLSDSVSGNIWNLPLSSMGFYDPENGDFRLKKDSPLIGMGVDAYYAKQLSGDTTFTNANSKIDFIGKPWNDPPSIGAYEYIEEKQYIPNSVYPMGSRISIPSYTKRIEYLQSTGSQYIVLNDLIPGNNFKVKIKWCPLASTNDRWIFGGGNTGGVRIGVYNAGTTVSFTMPNGTTVPLHLQNSGVTCTMTQGEFVETTATMTNTRNMYCFSQYWNGANGKIVAKLFWIKILSSSNKLLHEIVPLRGGSTGYLFDLVSSRIFSNDGTGNFTLGPDITT